LNASGHGVSSLSLGVATTVSYCRLVIIKFVNYKFAKTAQVNDGAAAAVAG